MGIVGANLGINVFSEMGPVAFPFSLASNALIALQLIIVDPIENLSVNNNDFPPTDDCRSKTDKGFVAINQLSYLTSNFRKRLNQECVLSTTQRLFLGGRPRLRFFWLTRGM